MFCSMRFIDQNQVSDFGQSGHLILGGDKQGSGFKVFNLPVEGYN